MKYKNREEFLNKLYNNIYMEEVVMHTSEKVIVLLKNKVFRASRKNTRYSKK